jgi:lysyl-tRNA synthetase class I
MAKLPPVGPPKERDIRHTLRYRQLAGSEGFQTVKPEAAQKAFDLREKAKEYKRRADSDKTKFELREKRSRQTAARLDRESKEALNDLETPRKVTANVPKRATSPRSNTAREERNLRGDS